MFAPGVTVLSRHLIGGAENLCAGRDVCGIGRVNLRARRITYSMRRAGPWWFKGRSFLGLAIFVLVVHQDRG
jgi:hypothetical protein